MKTDIQIIKKICHQFHTLENFSITIYDHNNIVDINQTHPITHKIFKRIIDILLASDKDALRMNLYDMILFYKIKVANTPYQIIIGPLPLQAPSNSTIRNFILENEKLLEYFDELKGFFQYTPIQTFTYYQAKIKLLYLAINHADSSIEDESFQNEHMNRLFLDKIGKNFDKDDIQKPRQTKLLGYEFEKKLLYYVEHGLIDKIESLNFQGIEINLKTLSSEPLRNYKLALATMNSLLIRAAIKGGLNFDEAYALGDYYSEKIEHAKSIDELSIISLAIKIDYCKKVHDIKKMNVGDTSIQKCISYIHQNINRNLSVDELADHVNFSKSYLSSKFAQVVGKKLTQYITETKIEYAKELLELTEKPIVEISLFLSFSSQSYFNNQFKKITGITPNQYRMKYSKNKKSDI